MSPTNPIVCLSAHNRIFSSDFPCRISTESLFLIVNRNFFIFADFANWHDYCKTVIRTIGGHNGRRYERLEVQSLRPPVRRV